MSNRTLIITIVVILAVAVGGVIFAKMRQPKSGQGLQIPPSEEKQLSQNATSTPAQPGECKPDFDANFAKNAKTIVGNRTVQFDVDNFGSFQIQLNATDAPKTAENMIRLVKAGFYDCLTFHRVAKGFVIQTGDPTGTGSGGQSAWGAPFADELNASTASYKTGYVKDVVAMANAGPNTNTSQFFITLADLNSALQHNYTIFGKVVAGQDVVDRIGEVPITPQLGPNDGKPVTPVVIRRAFMIN